MAAGYDISASGQATARSGLTSPISVTGGGITYGGGVSQKNLLVALIVVGIVLAVALFARKRK
jgi:hypothetical protein